VATAFQNNAFQETAFQVRALPTTSTDTIHKPINNVVEWLVPFKGMRETEYEISAAQRSEKTRVSKSNVRRYGAPSTFKVTTNKKGYE
jgi:hypothetical protein